MRTEQYVTEEWKYNLEYADFINQFFAILYISMIMMFIYEGKAKVKRLLKKQIYCKYTETKLTSLFNVISFDFKAPVPAFHKFLSIPPEKRFLVASLTRFASPQ
jgi:hypothetical protein